MKLRDKSPMRKKRARGLCLVFSAVACLVSAVIWWTSEDLDLIDHLIVSGSPFVFGAGGMGGMGGMGSGLAPCVNEGLGFRVDRAVPGR